MMKNVTIKVYVASN